MVATSTTKIVRGSRWFFSELAEAVGSNSSAHKKLSQSAFDGTDTKVRYPHEEVVEVSLTLDEVSEIAAALRSLVEKYKDAVELSSLFREQTQQQ